MQPYVGILDKIHVIKQRPLIVRFTLVTTEEPINCFVIDQDISNKLLLLENGKYTISATGRWNRRNHLIVESFVIRNPDDYVKKLKLDQ